MAKNVMKNDNLKPAQYRAVVALTASADVAAAARAAGVSERTLRRWMAIPEFRDEVCKAEAEVIRFAATRLGTLVDSALDVLESVMGDAEAAYGTRVRAATIVLDSCLRWREQTSLEDRLNQLEQKVRS